MANKEWTVMNNSSCHPHERTFEASLLITYQYSQVIIPS